MPPGNCMMPIFARISGTNSVQEIGDFDGMADAPDTRNDDSLKLVCGSFLSVGVLHGATHLAGHPA